MEAAESTATAENGEDAEHATEQISSPPEIPAKYIHQAENIDVPLPVNEKEEAELKCEQISRIKLIEENQLSKATKQKLKQANIGFCCCLPGSRCGESCICSGLYVECDPKRCSYSTDCANMPIQQKRGVPLRQFLTEKKGWGVKTSISIEKGLFVCQYIDEIVTEKVYKSRLQSVYKNEAHFYALYLQQGFVIDAHVMGNCARFINHSCDPNCEVQKWVVNGLPCMGIFALRDIKMDEELTFNYNFQIYNGESMKCHCDSSQCRGFIGSGVSLLVYQIYF